MRRSNPIVIIFGAGIIVILGLLAWRYLIANREVTPSSEEVAQQTNDSNFASYSSSGELKAGDSAPNFNLFDFTGELVTLSQAVQNQPVVLTFWSAKCEVCKTELVKLNELAGDNKDKVKFYGINRADEPESARDFVARLTVAFPTLWNPDDSAAQNFKVGAMPETFVIGRDLKIKAVFRGPVSKKDLSREIKKVI